MAADRQFFDKNPGTTRYLRRLAPAEAADLRLAGVVPDGWSAGGHVLVVELGPGLRARTFEGVHLFPGGVA